jgi:hypothetical protein
MLAKCIANEASMLPDHYRILFSPKNCKNITWPIFIGKTYVVCAINYFSGTIGYLVKKEEDAFPEFMPAPFFSIVDGRISKSWKYFPVKTFYPNNLDAIIGYPELCDGGNHYDDLVLGNSRALPIYERALNSITEEMNFEH